MKTYIGTTGVLFLALAVAHAVRVTQEPHLARDPFFIATTIVSLALAGWALRLYRRAATPG